MKPAFSFFFYVGYSICWDNVQKKTFVRHETHNEHNQMHMAALAYAAKNRIPFTSEDDSTVLNAQDIPVTKVCTMKAVFTGQCWWQCCGCAWIIIRYTCLINCKTQISHTALFFAIWVINQNRWSWWKWLNKRFVVFSFYFFFNLRVQFMILSQFASPCQDVRCVMQSPSFAASWLDWSLKRGVYNNTCIMHHASASVALAKCTECNNYISAMWICGVCKLVWSCSKMQYGVKIIFVSVFVLILDTSRQRHTPVPKKNHTNVNGRNYAESPAFLGWHQVTLYAPSVLCGNEKKKRNSKTCTTALSLSLFLCLSAHAARLINKMLPLIILSFTSINFVWLKKK